MEVSISEYLIEFNLGRIVDVNKALAYLLIYLIK